MPQWMNSQTRASVLQLASIRSPPPGSRLLHARPEPGVQTDLHAHHSKGRMSVRYPEPHMPVRITRAVAHDVRFPTSRTLDGSDAMNPDPDYSAAYVVLHTDRGDTLQGHGLTFTIGRGNELCVAAIEA